MRGRTRTTTVAVMAMLALGVGMTLPPRPAAAQAVPDLSQDSLKILVGGVALCPDGLRIQILQASAHPLQIRAAAGRGAPAGQEPLAARLRAQGPDATTNDPSVDALKAHPEILRALDANLPMTFRMGLAYQHQPIEVWAAIRSVRAGVENRLKAPAASPQPAQTSPPSTVVVGTQPTAVYPVPYPNYAVASKAGTSSAQRATGAQAQPAPWQAQAKQGRANQSDLTMATQSHHQSWNQLNQAFAKPAAPAGHAPKRGRRG